MPSKTNTGGTPDPAKLEAHPAAELFPLIEGAEFQELVEDIRANGLRTPILLHPDERVLDGRNRLRACLAAGVEPRFETWDGNGSPFELVVSLNLRRRHLNESQRAMLAARIKDTLAEEARKTRTEPGTNWSPGKAVEKAALLMNISPMSVKRAARVLRSGDQRLILLVRSGELPVSAAAEKLQEKLPPPAVTADAGPIRFPILHAEPRWERQKFEKLAALELSAVAAEDAVLFLRAPDRALSEAMKLLERWGFHYEASIVVGRAAHPGRYTRLQHDLLLIATRGRPPAPAKTPGSLAAAGERIEIEAIVEAMFPGLPRVDALAARARRLR